ncbi:MAG: hypothetical protein JWQ98_2199 [Chlorobi bacterium]|nr:hypothetical protein [Chlorobiota bacterium]
MVLTIAYLLMSMAGATHELSHMGSRQAGRSVAAPAHHQSISPASATSGHTLPGESKGDFCFFCSFGPSVLLAFAIAIIFSLRVFVTSRVAIHIRHRVSRPIISVISLRAPPALA